MQPKDAAKSEGSSPESEPDSPAAVQQGLAGRAVRGALVMVALRFTLRSIGLVSVVVMARLLTPADFGVVATAALVTELFVILQQIGIGEGLTRLRKIDQTHLCTAWTMGLASSALVTLLLVASTPFAARLLNEPKLVEVLPWLALLPLIGALGSPGSALLLRNLQFGKEFRLRTAQKILAVVATISCSLWFGDYHGLVAGSLFGALSSLALTYVLYPFRPTLTLAHWRYFTRFASWSLVQSVAQYVSSSIDEVFVRRATVAADFGKYHTSRDLSRVLVAEVVSPAAASLLPTLSQMSDDRSRFARATEHAVAVGALVAAGAASVVSNASEPIVRLLLGPQWHGAVPYLALFAFSIGANAVAELNRSILVAYNKVKVSGLLAILRAGFLAAACGATALLEGTPMTMANVYLACSLLMLAVEYAYTFTQLGNPTAIARAFARPVLAALVTLGVFHLVPSVATGWAVSDAILHAAAVACVYIGTAAAVWYLQGRPDGGERALLQRLPRRFRFS